ncbi:uncharacterized protein At5g65660-like isoform X2 [Malania oleifera]|uniref:uncharacterized protein At5g65660-like isoform X2 n=1 Tax=Malania oleifera TaxID=397392 RepID=UPI0025AE2FE7|nr:uncharacterized protein At5g65660-like isoform X2 [Malania oleifera]
MDNNNDESASTPTIGFPLATALLLLVLFGTSGLISCCYHWHRLRSLLPLLLLSHSPHPNSPAPQPPPIPLAVLPTTMHHLQGGGDDDENEYLGEQQQRLMVVMPGERAPRFIGIPCPHPPKP